MGIFFTILLGNIEVSYLELKISQGHKPAINHCHCENMVTVPSLVREIRTLVEIQNFTKRGNGTFDPKTSQSTDKLLNNKMKCRNMEKKTQSDIKILMWISTCKIRLLAVASALRDFLKYLKKKLLSGSRDLGPPSNV